MYEADLSVSVVSFISSSMSITSNLTHHRCTTIMYNKRAVFSYPKSKTIFLLIYWFSTRYYWYSISL